MNIINLLEAAGVDTSTPRVKAIIARMNESTQIAPSAPLRVIELGFSTEDGQLYKFDGNARKLPNKQQLLAQLNSNENTPAVGSQAVSQAFQQWLAESQDELEFREVDVDQFNQFANIMSSVIANQSAVVGMSWSVEYDSNFIVFVGASSIEDVKAKLA